MGRFTKEHSYFMTVMFSGAELLYWSSNCVLYSFIIMFLRDMGYSSTMCGFVSGLLACMGIFIHPISGYISDTFITGKRIILTCFAIAVPMTLILPKLVSMGLIFVVGVTVLSLFDCYQYSLIDSWVIKMAQNNPSIEFSRIRSFGSLGYGISALVVGQLIAKFGYNIMFYCHSFLVLLVILCLLPLPEVPCSNKGDSDTKKLSFVAVGKILMTNRTYVLLMISMALFQFGIRPHSTFLAIIVESLGGDSSHLGIATCISAGCEFPVMLAVSWILRHFEVKKPVLIGFLLALATLRMWMFTLPIPLYGVIGMQMISSVYIGIQISLFATYIAEIVPKEIIATATTMGTALTYGTGGVIGIFMGGVLIDNLGLTGYIWVCTIACGLGFLAFLPNVLAAMKKTTI